MQRILNLRKLKKNYVRNVLLLLKDKIIVFLAAFPFHVLVLTDNLIFKKVAKEKKIHEMRLSMFC